MNEAGLKVLPESIHDWDEVKNSENPESFWDRITNMRTKFGTALFKPGEDAGNEDWGKFSTKAIELSGDRLMPRPDLEDEEQRSALFKALGRPDDADGYEYAEIEGSELTDDHKKFMGEMAHSLGLTKKQLKALDQKLRETNLTSYQEAEEGHNTALKDLKQEWGLTYDDKVHAAKKVAKAFFPHLAEDAVLSADELKAFSSIAKQLGSKSSEFEDQHHTQPGQLSPNEAKDKIDEIRNNPEHPYHDRLKPGHAQAKLKMRELYLIKNNMPLDK